MKTFFITFLILYVSINVVAQQKIEMTYVTTDNDTSTINVFVNTHPFDRKVLDERSFIKNLYTKENGKNKKITTKNIKYLTFIDFNNKSRVFVSHFYYDKLREDKGLYEEMIKGKLSWYRLFNTDMYDGGLIYLDFFLLPNENLKFVNTFNGIKNELKLIISIDRPEFLDKLNEIKTYNVWIRTEKLLKIIKEYNDTF